MRISGALMVLMVMMVVMKREQQHVPVLMKQNADVREKIRMPLTSKGMWWGHLFYVGVGLE